MSYRDKVCTRDPVTKDRFQQCLAAAWQRITFKMHGMPAMAQAMGLSDTATIKRVNGMKNLPEAHTIFNALLADPTALDEVLGEYGFRLCPLTAQAANDMATLSGLCETAGELAEALRDNYRDHGETLKVADKIRPHLPALISIVREADGLRGAA